MTEATRAPISSMPARQRRRAPWIVAAVAVVAVAFIAVLATRPPSTGRAVRSSLFGHPAPDAAGRTIDGTDTRLSQLRGRWVVVNFFATWCVPCRKEHPDLVRFSNLHRARGDAAVFGIVYDDPADEVRRFRSAEGGDWPMLVDPGGKVALDFGVAGVPESFLITPGGVVVSKILGGVTFERLERLLAEARTQIPTERNRS